MNFLWRQAINKENTWESITAKMEDHVEDALANRADIERRIRIPVTYLYIPAAFAAQLYVLVVADKPRNNKLTL